MHSSPRQRARRRRAVVAGAAAAALAASLSSVPATGTPSAITTPDQHIAATTNAASTSKPPQIPANVRLYQTRESQLGLHKWYRQVKNGHVVAGGWWGWHRNDRTGRITVWDGRVNVSKLATESPKLGFGRAAALATHASHSDRSSVVKHELAVLPLRGSLGRARLIWAVVTIDGRGARTSYVDAVTGTVLKTVLENKKAHARRTDDYVTGRGRVFDPNPVMKLQNESLRDEHNSATAVPPAGYSIRLLPRLNAGQHSLVGRWVHVVSPHPAHSATNRYFYNRNNPDFEQTMAYHSIDTEQAYLQKLDFTDVNAESERIKVDAFPSDNSYYSPNTDQIYMGQGGVDDAEDPEVIWHEYGHAIQNDQVPDFGMLEQGGAIGEGFGDYMAVTMSQRFGNGTSAIPTACVMDWDATSYTTGTPHCLRRTNTNAHFPEDLVGEVHADGRIWSRALWDMNIALGRDAATRIIIEAQFWMNPRITFRKAATITVATAAKLYPDDGSVAQRVKRAFVHRGILS